MWAVGTQTDDDDDKQRRQMPDRIPELSKDRHFLDLSETCLYMVHLLYIIQIFSF